MTDATRVRPLQLRLCEMLIELDRVCRTQGLTYYLVAGTMLGAVRHQGFIPWDDDLDVGMPRADYDRLFTIAGTCLPPHLELKNFTSHPNFPWWFMKLEDSRTTLIEKTHFNYTGGVYIDIFPLDGEPADRRERRRHIKRIVRLQKICYYLHRDPYKRGQGVSSWPTRVCRRLYDRQQLHHRLDTELRRYDYDRSDWVCDHDHGEVSLMPKAYLGTPTPVLFEGLSFMGVAQPDAYLKSMYGDYMTLPPAGRRQQHDFHHVDLETPYRSHPSMVAS